MQSIIEVMENNPEIYQYVRHCPYEILREWQVSHYQSGETIFCQGEVYDSFHLVADGLLDINIMAENGKKYSQATYRRGDMIGELEIFERRPYVCNVEALTDVCLIGLRRDVFFQWLELDRNFSLQITRKITGHFYRLSRKAGEDNLYSLHYRICRYLLQILPQGIKRSGGIEVNVDKNLLSQQFAVTQRSINRILHSLREKGIIEINSQTLLVRDEARLAEEERLSRLI